MASTPVCTPPLVLGSAARSPCEQPSRCTHSSHTSRQLPRLPRVRPHLRSDPASSAWHHLLSSLNARHTKPNVPMHPWHAVAALGSSVTGSRSAHGSPAAVPLHAHPPRHADPHSLFLCAMLAAGPDCISSETTSWPTSALPSSTLPLVTSPCSTRTRPWWCRSTERSTTTRLSWPTLSPRSPGSSSPPSRTARWEGRAAGELKEGKGAEKIKAGGGPVEQHESTAVDPPFMHSLTLSHAHPLTHTVTGHQPPVRTVR